MSATAHRSRNLLARKLRQRKDQWVFDRALRDASPTMRDELYAAASRQHSHIM